MNDTLVAMVQQTEHENQKMIAQLVAEQHVNNVDRQMRQRLKEQRAETEDIARQRLIWMKQLGQTTQDPLLLGGPAYTKASSIANIISQIDLVDDVRKTQGATNNCSNI